MYMFIIYTIILKAIYIISVYLDRLNIIDTRYSFKKIKTALFRQISLQFYWLYMFLTEMILLYVLTFRKQTNSFFLIFFVST